MTKSNRRTTALALALSCALGATLAVLSPPALAQDKWPSKPISYVVPFPPGGTTDVLARLIGQKLGAALGTTVIVDNKSGAGGSVGSEYGRAPRPMATPSSAAPSARTRST